PSRRNRALPARVDRVVLALLAKQPEERPAPLVPAVDAIAGDVSFAAPPRLRRRRFVLVAAIGGALAGLVAFTWSRVKTAASPAATCARGSERLAGVWDDERKAAFAAHFATVDRPDVATTSRFIIRDFDAYAAEWARQWDAACI